jgi:hypothetical protein
MYASLEISHKLKQFETSKDVTATHRNNIPSVVEVVFHCWFVTVVIVSSMSENIDCNNGHSWLVKTRRLEQKFTGPSKTRVGGQQQPGANRTPRESSRSVRKINCNVVICHRTRGYYRGARAW